MAEWVLDASAVLAVLRGEPGAEQVQDRLTRAVISAANYAEVVSKLVDHGAAGDLAIRAAAELGVSVTPLDEPAATRAGALREATRARGLSLGDRACLALAQREGLPVLTADRAWADLDLGVEVVLIR
jgi:ribonuclease VapC